MMLPSNVPLQNPSAISLVLTMFCSRWAIRGGQSCGRVRVHRQLNRDDASGVHSLTGSRYPPSHSELGV
jgi:hypothetical protein